MDAHITNEQRLLLARKMRIANTVGFHPETDANDERAVFRHMCKQRFSVRNKFFRELDLIVQGHAAIDAHIAWPSAMMFMKDGDIARAALKILDQAG